MPTPEPNPTSNPNTNRELIAGADPRHRLDLLLVNAPLRDYAQRPRVNDFTLPVLGMAYIATYAATRGHNVGLLDAEAYGLSIAATSALINDLAPRWVGFNLLAPTYQISAQLAAALDPGIRLMLGGHHAKAMPAEILADPRMARCQALVIGEAETRVAELLDDAGRRAQLPAVMWLDRVLRIPVTGGTPGNSHHLAPDIDTLPFLDRAYLAQDPRPINGLLQANMVGARGCPYNCTFCGAAVSANPDVTIRTRRPDGILAEMHQLRGQDVRAFRFVDDLFLGARRVIEAMNGPVHRRPRRGLGALGRHRPHQRAAPPARPGTGPARRGGVARGRPRHRVRQPAHPHPDRQADHAGDGDRRGATLD